MALEPVTKVIMLETCYYKPNSFNNMINDSFM
jgi:hypothetical protein